MAITRIPYRPRAWARPFHASYARFAALVLCRRAGKSTALINQHIRAAASDEWETARLRYLVPTLTDTAITDLLRGRLYGHVMPTYKQAKLVAWAMLKHYADGIPGRVFNEQELSVKFPDSTGAKIQLFGSDSPDALRGAAFSGLSFDEYSQQPPNIFGEVLSKSLADHLGYAYFAGTIKGKNHLYRTYAAAKDDPAWFRLWQDVEKLLATEDDAATTMLRQAMIDDRALIAKGLMTQAEYDQEWFLSAAAAIKGAFYGELMSRAQAAGRIGRVPHEPLLPVETDWDLGIADSTAIWFSQSLKSGEVRLIDYYEASGEGLSHYVSVLQQRAQERGYVYGTHWAPHDIQVRELGTGKSRLETAASLGLKFKIGPQLSLEDGIQAVRTLLPKCWFDEVRCEHGLEGLRNYVKTWNSRLQEFTGTPVHSWPSHCLAGESEILTRNGTYQIQCLPPIGEVLTPCGWKPYRNPRITRKRVPLVAVTFSDGYMVRCTREHLFLTPENEWKSAEMLRPGTPIQCCSILSSNTSMVGCTVYPQPSDISAVEGAVSIGRCGPWRSDQFLMGVTSTIVMGIRRTIHWLILSVFQLKNISSATGFVWHLAGNTTSLPLLDVTLLSGTVRKQDDYGIVGRRYLPALGLNSGVRSDAVNTATMKWWQLFVRACPAVNTVLRRVRRGRIRSVFNSLIGRVSDVGIRSHREPNGHEDIATSVSCWRGSSKLNVWRERVFIVVRSLRWRLGLDIPKSTAQIHVRHLHVASVVWLASREDVWCLTVPDGECFSLGNGVVTHNSADSFRYLAIRHKTPDEKKRVQSDDFTRYSGSLPPTWMGG